MKQSNVKSKSLTGVIRIILFIYIICFFVGDLRHWLDIMHDGIFPYRNIPFMFNLYLTSLAILDFVTIVLLLMKPIHGLLLAVFIMATDLMTDFYIGYNYWHINIQTNRGLQLLTMFGLFVFLTAPFLIKNLRNKSHLCSDR